MLFLSSELLPLVLEFNQDTAQKTSSGEIKSHLLSFLIAKAESHADDVIVIADIAKDHKRILEFFGIPEAENIRAFVAKSLFPRLLAVNQLVFPKDLESASTLFTLEHLCRMYQGPSLASPPRLVSSTLSPATVLFLSSESLPLVMEFNQGTAQKTPSGDIKFHLPTFLIAKAESHANGVAVITDITKDHKRILEFSGIPEVENIRAPVAKSLYLKLPAVSLLVSTCRHTRESVGFVRLVKFDLGDIDELDKLDEPFLLFVSSERLCLMYLSSSLPSPPTVEPSPCFDSSSLSSSYSWCPGLQFLLPYRGGPFRRLEEGDFRAEPLAFLLAGKDGSTKVEHQEELLLVILRHLFGRF